MKQKQSSLPPAVAQLRLVRPMSSLVANAHTFVLAMTLLCVDAACTASPARRNKIASRPITPEPEVLSAASNARFAYLPTLRRAESGDSSAMRELVEFSGHTDAAAALAHGWVLLELRDIIGKAAFDTAVAAASPYARETTLSLIETAGTYEPYASAHQ